MHQQLSSPYHDDQNPHKDCNKICEEGECMLDVIHITQVSLLNDFLGVKDYVAHKHQETKIHLPNKRCSGVINGRKILEQLTNLKDPKSQTLLHAGKNAHTSNLKRAMAPPKMEDAKCNHMRRETPDERRPPRYKYSLRLANMAAAEKQPKTTPQPTKAPSTMLQQKKIMYQKSLSSPGC